jgi:hypothetical protein
MREPPTSVSLLSTKPSESRFNNIRQITHKELTTHKQAQVIVTTHASKHKTRTKEEHMINEILKVLIEER